MLIVTLRTITLYIYLQNTTKKTWNFLSKFLPGHMKVSSTHAGITLNAHTSPTKTLILTKVTILEMKKNETQGRV